MAWRLLRSAFDIGAAAKSCVRVELMLDQLL